MIYAIGLCCLCVLLFRRRKKQQWQKYKGAMHLRGEISGADLIHVLRRKGTP